MRHLRGKLMKPIGPLMWEHRLIEKMLRLLKRDQKDQRLNRLDTVFIDTAGILSYYATGPTTARRRHSIPELAKRKLLPEHAAIMDELWGARHARQLRKLVSARNRYLKGGYSQGVMELLGELPVLSCAYRKEDKRLLFPSWITLRPEQQKCGEFNEFDRGCSESTTKWSASDK